MADATPGTVAEVMEQFSRSLIPMLGPEETKAVIRAVLHERIGLPFPELDRQRKISPADAQTVGQDLHRLRTGEPLQYVLGHVQFHGLRIAVDPRALIPRPETEELVDRIIRSRAKAPASIVDLCTGSGCIALALKKAFPNAVTTGLDLSMDALDLARTNAAALNLLVEWQRADVLSTELETLLRAAKGAGDTLVVSNPPYVPEGDREGMAEQVLLHEPHLALFVKDHDPQAFFRAIAGAAASVLGHGDALWLEGHHRHAAETKVVVEACGFREVELISDLSGNLRFIRACK